MALKHVIIGASAAGIAAAQKIRQLNPDDSITLISAESEYPYNKCLLADYVSGTKTEEQVIILSEEQALSKKVTLLRDHVVEKIVPEEKLVLCANGVSLSYDTLCIATGARPKIPPIPGITTKGVMPFYGLADAQRLIALVQAQSIKHAVVIGAGLSGLECADALTTNGVSVEVVEMAGQVLARQVTSAAAGLIQQALVCAGARLHLNRMVTQISANNGTVVGVVLDNGHCLEADVVICAIGAQPNSEIAHDIGLAMHDRWILVNEYMQTSIPGIYAAGDVVMVRDMLTGELVPSCTWPDAMQQGMVAAHTMAGVAKTYPGVTVVTSSAFFGVKFATCGPVINPLPDQELIERITDDEHAWFVIGNNRLKGFQIVGKHLSIGTYRRLVLTQQEIDSTTL